MKKIIIGIGICLAFVVVFIVSILLLLQKNKSEQKVLLCNWYDYEKNEVIIVPTKEIKYSMPYSFSAYFTSTSKDLLAQIKNEQIFVEDRSLFIDNYDVEGSLLFNDNNYYFVYEVDNSICIRNMICTIEYNGLSLVIPFQSFFTLDIYNIPSSKDKIKNYFESITFEESQLFYSKFDTEFIQIDDKTKQITVSSLDINSNKRYQICIDYTNKVISIFIENKLQYIYI